MKDFIAGFKGKPLNNKQIATGMHSCYMNARALVDEAKILRGNGCNARALSLAILALEELGKIPLICEGILYQENDASAWQRFWKDFQSHQTKLRVWSYYGKQVLHLFGEDYGTEFPSGIESLLDKLKQLGFYVDFYEGQFIVPEDFANDNSDWIDWLITILDERIESFRPLHSSLESSEGFVDKGIKFLGAIKGAKSPDQLKVRLSEWFSQNNT